MYGPVANTCEHAYETRLLGGHPISVRLCTLCHTPDWDDLYQQADTLFRWGREEGLAGKPQRDRISAYDMPASEAGEIAERAIRKVSVRFELEQVRADLARSSEQVIDLTRRAETAEHRLRLAHQARRAKEHQLDGIRRALCDIGFMEDDDPYSHADLADVIRQNGQALADQSYPAPSEAADGVAPCPNCGPPGLCPKHCPCRECSAQIGAAVRADVERQMRHLRTQQGGA